MILRWYHLCHLSSKDVHLGDGGTVWHSERPGLPREVTAGTLRWMVIHRDCPALAANRDVCTCTYEPCSRKGNCCACLQYHLASDELPGCCFPAEVERTYDRSFRRFVAVRSQRST